MTVDSLSLSAPAPASRRHGPSTDTVNQGLRLSLLALLFKTHFMQKKTLAIRVVGFLRGPRRQYSLSKALKELKAFLYLGSTRAALVTTMVTQGRRLYRSIWITPCFFCFSYFESLYDAVTIEFFLPTFCHFSPTTPSFSPNPYKFPLNPKP